ncbi:MAG: hypothetical protein PHI27_02545 [Eubacteriales bacterium]|nr:hypothetical protein [Eubacteriales bacterium]MDD3881113.1 hypothetical protein [Eubacteriales bacterium]MDD4511495.1 hypothetical protein [Eubacteriales bacterium]
MANYTIDDVELLRRRAEVTYEEAVALLDMMDGDVPRCLAELEKRGKLRSESAQSAKAQSAQGAEHKKIYTADVGLTIGKLFQKAYACRVMVKKDGVMIINLSVLFLAIALLSAPYLLAGGLLLSLILGYRISFVKSDPAFVKATLQTIIQNAGHNVRSSMQSFTGSSAQQKKKPEVSEEDKREMDEQERTYEELKKRMPSLEEEIESAKKAQSASVEFNADGSITVEKDDDDGFSSATIK